MFHIGGRRVISQRRSQRRDFTFVGDIAPAIAAALTAEGLAPYEVLNLGNHRPESVMDVIRLISRNRCDEKASGLETDKWMRG
jgi:nucleoside-diphosphate-sugar epimerase